MPIADGSIGNTAYVTRHFTESTGAGTYTATVTIPSGATLVDCRWANIALWTATTSATLNVGDGDDSDGYFIAINVKAAPAAGATGVGSVAGDTGSGAYAGLRKNYPSGGTITATVVTVGAAGAAGKSILTVEYQLGAPAGAEATKA